MSSVLLVLALSASPRLALSVGTNAGSEDRDPLWFAESDAQRFGDALVELAQFQPDDVRVLKGPDVETLDAALEALIERAKSFGTAHPPLVVFYYSGHANASGLQLGPHLYPYSRLSLALGRLPEGVHVAILDACHSGALTQVKGARPAPLDFEVVREPKAEGLAIITSSSASEQAQESAQLQGSFFTHHFVAGLRGAADADADGRVTLTESYRYAYHRTLAATSASGAAPQHPTWAMRMSGKGEVVLVDLRDARSTLSFTAGEGKSYLVTNARTQEVVAEVSTGPDPLKVALPEGRYRIERLVPAPRLAGDIVLTAQGGATVDDAQLTPLPTVAARAKGDLELERTVRTTFLGAEVWVGSPILHDFGAGYGVGLSLRHDFRRVALLGGVSYSQKLVDDVGFSYRYQAGTLWLAAAARFDFGSVALLLGLKGAGAYAVQTAFNGGFANDFVFSGGPIAGIAVPVVDHFAVRALLGGMVNTFGLNGAQVARFSVEAAFAVEWGP
jgi:hypothetical protein